MFKTLTNNLTEQQKLEIEIIVSSYAHCDDSWHTEKPFSSSYSRLYYIKSGMGYVVHNNTTTPLFPGNVYFIPAGTTMSYYCKENETLEKLYFHLTMNSTESYDLLSFSKPGVYSFPITKITDCNIFQLFFENSYTGVLKLKTILYETISAFYGMGIFDDIQIKAYSPTMKQVLRYIKEHIHANMNLAELSSKLSISKSIILNVFKNEAGITPGRYIDELIIARAKKLLLYRDLSIKDVSDKLGFCDQFYFSKRFKEKTGHTPSQFRKNELTRIK